MTFTVVVPFGKNEPDGGTYVIVPQDPVIPGPGRFTYAPQRLGAVTVTMLLGHWMVQKATVNEIVEPADVILLI